ISPDLTVRGDIKPAGPGRENRNRLGVIASIGSSPLDPSLIWIGTSNGMIKLTQDHGATWSDVTIANLPGAERTGIRSIEAAPTNRAEAYATALSGDNKPHVYRTRDLGRSWTEVVNGLPTGGVGGNVAYSVHADPMKGGVLFLLTGSSVYFSTDD